MAAIFGPGILAPALCDPGPAPPKLVSCPTPTYPPAARQAGEQGKVELQVFVDADGAVLDTRVTGGSGFADLDEAAREGAAQCRFTPTRQNGDPGPAPVWRDFRFNWKLPSRSPPAQDRCPDPIYPEEARRAGEEGKVTLSFMIGPDGLVKSSKVLITSGFADLDEAALSALARCSFKPAIADGHPDPEPAEAILRFNWKLEDDFGPPDPSGDSSQLVLRCSGVPSLEDFADQLDEVTAWVRLGRSLRAVLPKISGSSDMCQEYLRRAQIEALKKAKLFDHVELSDNGDGTRPAWRGEDYTLWVEEGQIMIAFREGLRIRLPTGLKRLGNWLPLVLPQFTQARRMAQPSSVGTGITQVGAKFYYGYRGREYASVDQLMQGAAEHVMRDAQAVVPVEQAGTKLRIILVPGKSLAGPLASDLSMNDYVGAQVQSAFVLLSFAEARGRAEALLRSGLFLTTTIEESVVAVPECAEDEVVIWNGPDPNRWHMRVNGGAPLALPTGELPDQWVQRVRATFLDVRRSRSH